MKQCRHQLGVPCSPTRRAVSAGMLWVGHELLLLADRVEEAERVRAEADQPDSATSARPSPAATPTRMRSRRLTASPPAPSTRNGSTSPAVTLMPDARGQRQRAGAEAWGRLPR